MCLQGMSKRERPMTIACLAWMKSFFDLKAQYYPNKERRYISYESFRTRKAIHDVYKGDETAAGRLCVTYDHFCKLWMKHFSRVEFPRSIVLAKCDACEEIGKALALCTSSSQENTGARALKTMQTLHMEKMNKDRFVYQCKR